MSKFEVGDKVVCVHPTFILSGTEIYTVQSITHDEDSRVYVKLEDQSGEFFDWRFEKYAGQEKKYTVEEVLQTYFEAIVKDNNPVYFDTYVETIKSRLEKQSDPEYQQYLKLKEKFGD